MADWFLGLRSPRSAIITTSIERPAPASIIALVLRRRPHPRRPVIPSALRMPKAAFRRDTQFTLLPKPNRGRRTRTNYRALALAYPHSASTPNRPIAEVSGSLSSDF
jgi:hypothetical protein